MATTLSEVYDLFMLTITDYRLNHLFDASEEDFENYVEAWLKFAIVEFNMCDQDLNYDEVEKTFTDTLTLANKVILAKLMMKYWMQKNVNDITQMNLHVTDRDFKIASESMNLREKASRLRDVQEECSQLLIDYAYKRNDWTGWLDQDFFGV